MSSNQNYSASANAQRQTTMPIHKYKPWTPVDLPDRKPAEHLPLLKALLEAL